MDRARANSLALSAIRSILDSGRREPVEVDGKLVAVHLEPAAESRESAPPTAVAGLDDEEWPAGLSARCSWDGGEVLLALRAAESRGRVGFSLRIHPRRKLLLWFALTKSFENSGDGETVPIRGSVGLRKRKRQGMEAAHAAATAQLQKLVRASGMPLLQKSVELFRVRPEDGVVLPSPAEALERILRLALYKLDFFARDPRRRAERGTPLISVPSLDGLEDGDDEDADETEDRRYWAGGFLWTKDSQLDRFLAENIWEMGWDRNSRDSAALTAWQRFDSIEVGDLFAIKGLGGTHDLRVHAVSEVLEIDAETGRLKLRRLNVPPYSGKAPRGTGAGNWHDALLRVQRKEDVEQIFGVGRDEHVESDDETRLQPNLILYGPPGTGKTFALREQFLPRFRGDAPTVHGGVDPELLERLTWFEVAAAALHELGVPTPVKALSGHSWVVAKFAIRPFKSPIGARLWGALQTHTVQDSKTVQYSLRTGELIFDKDEDGNWFLPGGAPEHVREVAEALGRQAKVRDRFRFITFHQSYGYEDFIEGIRPRTTEDGDEGGHLSYDLVDGVFLRAVRTAIELTGYERSVDEFCTELSAEERAELLENAPPYAVFIDEINRGNVARIFGELITLIEPTRRLGEPEELIVTLPASNTRFGVPSNLHLIGTMNTADRSIEVLDTALRRRFAFQECPPRPDLVDVVIEGNIEPRRLLTTINQRILKLLDRDHLIGHAYFMPLVEDPSFERLQAIFRDSILPLLQEYFYGDWGRIGLVLGRDFVRQHDHGDVPFADFPHEDADALAERSTYELADLDLLSSEAFRRIYADDRDDD